MMDAGLFLSAEAELTGDATSAPVGPLDASQEDGDDAIWGTGGVAVFV